MSSIEFTIFKPEEINRAMNWADANISAALTAGPVVMTLGRQKRTNEEIEN